MNLSRRRFMRQATGSLAAITLASHSRAAAAQPTIRVGACVVGLEAAKQAGLDGVEVGAGGEADTLNIFQTGTRERLHQQMKATGLPVCSIMMGLLNQYPLASDPRAPAWLEQCIDAARDIGAKTVLVAFFGKGDLQSGKQIKEPEFNAAVARLKAAAPRAAAAGVTLAVENMLSAEQNLRLLEAVGHDAVRIYYDVYNTGKSQGYDAAAEIRTLKGRIAQIHFKNGPKYLDDDKPFFERMADAITETGYKGWIVLETSSPSKNSVADAKRNADYVRSLFSR
ncbi:MAG TPA: sugar phosphate isomerase/epimerase family protein [Kiritimatiellia bacterium]|nr:sugar phosphate isomerase/epimerase family protein [Kiritimatiellia bacterium]